MANEIPITVIGNLTGDPELRFTPSGAAVANFTVASTPRTFDKNSNEWKDGETLFMRCSVWREVAENVAESLHRGTRVIVTGRLKSRSWDDKETGQKRTSMEMDVDEVGPSLRYATTQVTKTQRSGGNSGGNSGGGQQDDQSWGGAQQGQGGDPWGAPQGQPQGAPQGQPQPQGAQQGGGWGAPASGGGTDPWGGRGRYDEPPF